MIVCFVLNYVGTEYWFFYTGYVREEFKTQLPVDRWFHPVLAGLYCSKQPPCTGRNDWSTSSWILKLPLSFICNSPYNVPCDFWSQTKSIGRSSLVSFRVSMYALEKWTLLPCLFNPAGGGGYCKSGNFHVTLIFALFVHFWASAKLKTRESVYFVCRSM